MICLKKIQDKIRREKKEEWGYIRFLIEIIREITDFNFKLVFYSY